MLQSSNCSEQPVSRYMTFALYRLVSSLRNARAGMQHCLQEVTICYHVLRRPEGNAARPINRRRPLHVPPPELCFPAASLITLTLSQPGLVFPVESDGGLARCIDSCGSAKPIDSTGEREQMLSCRWRHVDSSPEASRSIKMSQILNNFIWWRPEMFSLNRWWNQLCWRWANFFFFLEKWWNYAKDWWNSFTFPARRGLQNTDF